MSLHGLDDRRLVRDIEQHRDEERSQLAPDALGVSLPPDAAEYTDALLRQDTSSRVTDACRGACADDGAQEAY